MNWLLYCRFGLFCGVACLVVLIGLARGCDVLLTALICFGLMLYFGGLVLGGRFLFSGLLLGWFWIVMFVFCGLVVYSITGCSLLLCLIALLTCYVGL